MTGCSAAVGSNAMTITAKVLIGYLVLALVVFAWMFRYGVVSTGGATSVALVTDRWTGTVYHCFGGCSVAFPRPSN